jgi:MoaA/NifB/PqqE/SkfB family radical SAM enzyme
MTKYQKILDRIPPTGMVTLHGIGEPMLHPEFLDIVRLAKESRKFRIIKVTSNGVTRSPKFWRQAVDLGLDQIWISVDSFDPIVAAQLRFGTNVEKLKRNIKGALAEGLPVHISNVVSRINLYDLEHTLKVLYQLGNPTVHSQEFQDFGDDFGVLSVAERAKVKLLFDRLRNELPGIRVIPPQFTNPVGEVCSAPWSRPAISVDGYLTPCCTTFDPSHFGFADLSMSSFEEIYESDAVQSWLTQMADNEMEMCNGCGLNPRLNLPSVQLARSGKTGRELHVIR